MAERAIGSLSASGRPSLLARVLDRWRGGQDARPEPGSDERFPAAAPPAAAPVEAVAPLDRTDIAQWLWGPGFTLPGGGDYVRGLVKPFALNPAMSVLDVAAGLGGPARTIAHAFGTYVTAMERDPAIAHRGMQMSVADGMAKRAPVTAIDPESFELRTAAYDCILGREATCALADKERFLRVLIMGLKARGQLLLTDFVTDPESGERQEVGVWARLQPYRPSLWTLAQYTDCLTSLGFEIRITEDMTAGYRGQVILGWEHLLQTVKLRSLPRQHLLAVVDEAERWVRTIAALETGALRMYRFYALAGQPRPAATGKRGG